MTSREEPNRPQASQNKGYRGRFAPSPTGPLHFGSLVTAIASYLEARCNHGEWLVRIEDLDPPREVAGADTDILRALDAHGFEWDEEPLWQSTRLDIYASALNELHAGDLAYVCHCARKQLSALAKPGPLGLIYPGICSNKKHSFDTQHAIRLRTHNHAISFNDKLQGHTELNLHKNVGDFLIRRGDGLAAYHLAVTVDDALQNITDVVRGSDLLMSTPCHIHLQQSLGYIEPSYMHLPIAIDASGKKLCKRGGADELNLALAGGNLLRGMRFLGLRPPAELENAGIAEIWLWARDSWNIEPLRGVLEKPEIGHLK